VADRAAQQGKTLGDEGLKLRRYGPPVFSSINPPESTNGLLPYLDRIPVHPDSKTTAEDTSAELEVGAKTRNGVFVQTLIKTPRRWELSPALAAG
jgi:hypothetical protein